MYNAEVPASKLREVSQDAKQRAHSEVNRLMARQRRRILGGGAADETASIVSSCSSFQIGGRGGGRMRGGGGDAAADDEEQAEPPRYGLGCDIAIAGFLRFRSTLTYPIHLIATHSLSTAAAPAGSTRSVLRSRPPASTGTRGSRSAAAADGGGAGRQKGRMTWPA